MAPWNEQDEIFAEEETLGQEKISLTTVWDQDVGF